MKKYITIISIPLLFAHILSLVISPKEKKEVIYADLNKWNRAANIYSNSKLYVLCYLLIFFPEYRTLFYYRLGWKGKLLNFFLRQQKLLFISTKKIGGGLYLQHAFSTIIFAKQIGENNWINQNVTIGSNGKGIPTIGDNVSIGAGAVIIGPIKIGNNVKIGANAIVVKDVPDNCTVVSHSSRIIYK